MAVRRHALWSLLVGVSLFAADGGWLDVPFVKQEKNGCGAASLAMLIRYWQQQGQPVPDDGDPARIQAVLYDKDRRGIQASALEAYLREHGFRVFVFAGSLRDLRENIGKGRPVLVALKPGGNADLHYVVVAGITADAVLVNDPAQRKLLRADRAIFEKEWKQVGNWALLAVPQAHP